MAKLNILPDEESYTITPKSTFIAKAMTYGNFKRRRDYDNADFFVTVQWTLDLATFSELNNFIISNTTGFSIDLLILTSYLIEYDVRLLPDTFKIISTRGDSIICGATLAVLPDMNLIDCHKETVYIENCLNDSLDPVINQLNFLFSDIKSNPALST